MDSPKALAVAVAAVCLALSLAACTAHTRAASKPTGSYGGHPGYPIAGAYVGDHGFKAATSALLGRALVARDRTGLVEFVVKGTNGCAAPRPNSVTIDAPNHLTIEMPHQLPCALQAWGDSMVVVAAPGIDRKVPLTVVVDWSQEGALAATLASV